MQPKQIVGIGTRKAREVLVPTLPVDFDRLYERHVPDTPETSPGPLAQNTGRLRSSLTDTTAQQYRTRAREAARGTPTFLNRTLRVADGPDIDWYDDRFDELPLLWSLKLYAFQPVSWVCKGFEPGGQTARELQQTFDGWIGDWIDSVEIGGPRYLRRAWTPWAVSLRILHWCRYFAWRESNDSRRHDGFERAFRREIFKNALFVGKHVERDVGGNHLIENGAALAVAGHLFDEQSWIDAGKSILTDAARTQFLDDGCHFERSPMYHVLALTRYLTVCDLLGESGRAVPADLEATATEGTAFLRYLQPPDGRIPLLNDAVYGQALPLPDWLRYARGLGFAGTGDRRRRMSASAGDEPAVRASNYRWLRTDDGAMLVDGGRVGPPHLPGHSHSDTLSVLLWLDGQPVVTDTGTFGYVSGPRRTYARGVRGHNTVQVGDAEPIALSGKYLMGPRPDPETRFETGPVSLFEGRYDADPFGSPAYTHHRAAYAGKNWWIVRDTVCGHGDAPVRGRLHLHPDINPSVKSTGRVRLAADGVTSFARPMDGTRVGVTTGHYFPRFGVARDRPVLELDADDTRSNAATLCVLLTRQDTEEPDVGEAPGSVRLTRLHMAGEQYELPRVQLQPAVDA